MVTDAQCTPEWVAATLPPIDALDSSARSAVDRVGALLPPGAKVLGSELAGQLRSACASATGITDASVLDFAMMVLSRSKKAAVGRGTGLMS